MLAAADLHVARRLAELAGEEDEAVILAAALAVRGPRLGHVFVDVEEIRDTVTVDTDEPVDLSALPWPDAGDWLERLAASPLVAVGEEPGGPASATPRRPLALPRPLLARGAPGRRRPAARLAGEARAAVPEEQLARLFEPGRQRDAAETALRRQFAVIAGGPGTGKTTTVARTLALILEQGDPLIALAAPTGKAAARLTEAVHDEAAKLDIDERRAGAAAQPRGHDPAPPARLAARHPQPLPPRPRQPPPARRRGRRRGVDGVPVADGAARRSRAARRAADPRRRPRPARLDRGRRGARRHRRPPPTTASSSSTTSTASASRSPTGRGDPARRRRRHHGRARRRDVDRRSTADAVEPLRRLAVTAGTRGVAVPLGGRRRAAPSGARRVPAAVRAPPRPVRRQRLDGADRGVARPCGERLVRRPPAARDRERLRAQPLQRRHRRGHRGRRRAGERRVRARGPDRRVQPPRGWPPSTPCTR